MNIARTLDAQNRATLGSVSTVVTGIHVRIGTPLTQVVVTGPGGLAAAHAQHITTHVKHLAAVAAEAAASRRLLTTELNPKPRGARK